MKPETNARFWSHIHVSRDSDCWLYTKGCFPFGHGCFKAERKSWMAHRMAWVLLFGELAPNLCVLHRCDNPPCCNPAHLFLGTKSDNSADMISKGRHARGDRHAVRKNPLLVTGMKNPRAVMTDDLVRELRTLWTTGEFRAEDLGIKFGISTAQAYRIATGSQWTHVS
jgi:hypothetical protein